MATPSPPPTIARTHRPGTDPALVEAPATAGIFQALSSEWADLCTLPSMPQTLRRWAKAEPALCAAESLGDLLDRIDAGDRSVEDRYLLALVRLAQNGQQLAGRVLVQAMLPKLARFAATVRPTSNDDRWTEDRRHIVVATFWEIVHTYPADRRRTRVAANLALDTLHRLTRDLRRPPADIPLDPEWLSRRVHQPTAGRFTDPGKLIGILSPDADLLEVIAWGLDVKAITSDDASLLVRVYLADDDCHGVASIARELHVSPAAIRQRCSRARRRLTSAVHGDVHGTHARLQPA